MNDPVAEILLEAVLAAMPEDVAAEFGETIEVDDCIPEADGLRARRLELVRALYPDVDELLLDIARSTDGTLRPLPRWVPKEDA